MGFRYGSLARRPNMVTGAAQDKVEANLRSRPLIRSRKFNPKTRVVLPLVGQLASRPASNPVTDEWRLPCSIAQ